MTVCAPRGYHPLALGRPDSALRHSGPQLRPPSLMRRTVYLGGRIPCGQPVDFALAGERVDSPWTATQS